MTETAEERFLRMVTTPSSLQGTTAPSDLWLNPAEVIAAMAKEGDPVPTGWAPLDNRLRRGGIPPGRVISIGGPPFAGKTTVVAQIAVAMAQRIQVFALFSDEGRTQAAMRIGVMLGVPLERIEEHPAEAGQELSQLLGERSIYLLKPETEVANATEVFDYAVKHRQEGQPALVILDSVQTIPPEADHSAESERIVYKQLMGLCRSKASEHGLIVLLTSQSNRASYSKRKAEENSVAIASFSGTAAIEFLSDVAVVLSLPDEESETVKVEMVKNRLINSAHRLPRTFTVKYDPATGQMLELDAAAVETAQQAGAEERLRPVASEIHAAVEKGKELSGAEIERRMRGRGKGFGTASVRAALHYLVNTKKSLTELYREGKGGGYFYAVR
jgi:RecA/RadA recombinase